jgi:hypothetical protein
MEKPVGRPAFCFAKQEKDCGKKGCGGEKDVE